MLALEGATTGRPAYASDSAHGLESFDLKENAAAVDAYRVGAHGVCRRIASRPTISNVELALVQRALDLMAVEKTVAQSCVSMGAEVVRRIYGRTDGVDGDVAATDLHANDVIAGEIGNSHRVQPLGGIAH